MFYFNFTKVMVEFRILRFLGTRMWWWRANPLPFCPSSVPQRSLTPHCVDPLSPIQTPPTHLYPLQTTAPCVPFEQVQSALWKWTQRKGCAVLEPFEQASECPVCGLEERVQAPGRKRYNQGKAREMPCKAQHLGQGSSCPSQLLHSMSSQFTLHFSLDPMDSSWKCRFSMFCQHPSSSTSSS